MKANEIAELTGGQLEGATEQEIAGVAALEEAEPHQVSFLSNPRYTAQVQTSRAAVVIVPMEYPQPPPEGRAWVRCANPNAAFTRLVDHFAPEPIVPPRGRHPSAVVAADAEVPESCHVGACAVIEAGVVLGDNCTIMAGCYLGHGTRLGADCLLYPNVTVRERCRIGDRVIIHPNAVIGSDGFGFEPGREGHRKIAQVGIVQLDDDVEVGAGTTIDRARFGRTWIKRGVKIDNLVQIAHNCEIGEHTFVVAQVGLAGSVKVGKFVQLAGQVGVPGHVSIGDGSIIMGKSGALSDVAPGEVLMGLPAVPRREFMKQHVLTRKLPELWDRLRHLERQLSELQGGEEADGEPPAAP